MQPGQTATKPHPAHTNHPSTTARTIRCCTHTEAAFPRRTPITTPPSRTHPPMASHCPHHRHPSRQRRQLCRKIKLAVFLPPHRRTRPLIPLLEGPGSPPIPHHFRTLSQPRQRRRHHTHIHHLTRHQPHMRREHGFHSRHICPIHPGTRR